MKTGIINKINEMRNKTRREQFERPAVYVPQEAPKPKKQDSPKPVHTSRVIVINMC